MSPTAPVTQPGGPALARALGIAAAALTALYALMCLAMSNLPWNDMPNHTARGLVMADLLFHGGRQFGSQFELHAGFDPYLLGDLLLAALSAALAPDVAGRVFMALCVVGLPASVLLFLRTTALGPAARALAALAALVVATDNTWVLGFSGYRLGLPLLFVAVYFGVRFFERGGLPLASAYVAAVAAGYLAHLATPVLLAPVVGAAALACWPWQRPQWPRVALLGAVPAAMVLWGALAGGDPAAPAYTWAPLAAKLAAAPGLLARYPTAWNWDRALTLLFLVALLPGLLRVPTLLRSRDARVATFAAAASAALYLALPSSQGMIFGIDTRALPPMYLFAAIASFAALTAPAGRVASFAGAAPIAVGVAITALAALNLGHVWTQLRHVDDRLGQVRATLAALPREAHVLPIVTRIRQGDSVLHASAFTVIDRGGLTPYLFSGDQNHPQVYFRYRAHPAAPSEFWFVRGEPVDWPSVRRDWPYLLVVGPQEGLSLPFPTLLLRATSAAALFAVDGADGAGAAVTASAAPRSDPASRP